MMKQEADYICNSTFDNRRRIILGYRVAVT